MSILHLDEPAGLIAPSMLVAFDGWVDAGSAATVAGGHLADTGEVIATLDGDALFDYRARRPTLDIVDGRPKSLDWPELALHRRRLGDRDLLVLAGPEPDYRWRDLATEMVEMAKLLHIQEWISLGAIPAAVPHTRPVPIIGTESEPGHLRGDVQPGPAGLLRVPAAAVSVLDLAVSEAGIACVGYFAQIPHYVTGPYPQAAVALLDALGQHLGVEIEHEGLTVEARELGSRLDVVTAADETTRAYVERLQSMVDESRLPSGEELISDIERFLRDRGSGSSRLN